MNRGGLLSELENAMPERIQFPIWDTAEPEESLMLMHQWAVDRAHGRIKWYESRSKKRKTLSQWLRIIVIFNAAAGALCPLIDATGVFLSKQPGVDSFTLGKWGYVFIALAAAIAGFDRYFGLSTGWMRFIVTQLSLERILQEFHYDWASLLAQQQEGQVKSNTPLLQRVKDFSLHTDIRILYDWLKEKGSMLKKIIS